MVCEIHNFLRNTEMSCEAPQDEVLVITLPLCYPDSVSRFKSIKSTGWASGVSLLYKPSNLDLHGRNQT